MLVFIYIITFIMFLNKNHYLFRNIYFFSKKNAFKNQLFVPYQAPLKLGLSANKTILPFPIALTTNDADGLMNFSKLF